MDIDKIQTSVLQDFDFNKVHTVMEAIGWKWAQHDGYRTPTADELKLLALTLVRQAIQEAEQEGYANCGTGGFCAKVRNGNVELKFVLESCLIGS